MAKQTARQQHTVISPTLTERQRKLAEFYAETYEAMDAGAAGETPAETAAIKLAGRAFRSCAEPTATTATLAAVVLQFVTARKASVAAQDGQESFWNMAYGEIRYVAAQC